MFNKVFYYEQTILYKHRIEDNVSFVVNYDMNSVQWFVKTNCVIKWTNLDWIPIEPG